MAQLIKYLPHKPEDPQNPHKKLGMVVCACLPLCATPFVFPGYKILLYRCSMVCLCILG